jgi:hypothetical protein
MIVPRSMRSNGDSEFISACVLARVGVHHLLNRKHPRSDVECFNQATRASERCKSNRRAAVKPGVDCSKVKSE